MLGKDVEKLSDAQLEEAAKPTTIFAKMSPVQKSRVIRALQRNGHTVGYLGDGINDAVALKDADVGISVDTAVDIAKESASCWKRVCVCSRKPLLKAAGRSPISSNTSR